MHLLVRVYLLASLRPCILTSLCLCVHACIFAFLHPYILRFMCPHLHPCILISSGSYVLASIIVSSHPHILRVMYSGCLLISRILTSRYLYVRVLWVLVGILTHSHLHILRFQCSYLFGKLKSDKTNVSNTKTAFMETNNGSNKFLTK